MGRRTELSVELLLRQGIRPRSLLLVQDPTMQRRTHASFERALRRLPGTVVLSHAPFVPTVATAASWARSASSSSPR